MRCEQLSTCDLINVLQGTEHNMFNPCPHCSISDPTPQLIFARSSRRSGRGDQECSTSTRKGVNPLIITPQRKRPRHQFSTLPFKALRYLRCGIPSQCPHPVASALQQRSHNTAPLLAGCTGNSNNRRIQHVMLSSMNHNEHWLTQDSVAGARSRRQELSF